MMFLVRACDLGEALAMRKEYIIRNLMENYPEIPMANCTEEFPGAGVLDRLAPRAHMLAPVLSKYFTKPTFRSVSIFHFSHLPNRSRDSSPSSKFAKSKLVTLRSETVQKETPASPAPNACSW